METLVAEKPQTVAELLQDARNLRAEVENHLKLNGIAYQLDDWLTIKKYCERFGIEDTQIVTNWIRRGVIPSENVREIKELNGIRLIKAIAYR